jgi:predicted nucleic acid-binding protein
VLRQREAAAHQSLQEYLRSRLIAEATSRRWKRCSTGRAGALAVRSRSLTESRPCRGTVLVVAASVLSVALADDGPDGDTARGRLRRETLAGPELVDLEVASVLRRQNRAGLVVNRRADLALADLAGLPMHRSSHRALLARCWELRDSLTTYDAAYVALAEAWNAILLTGDRRLAHASGPTCTIELLTRLR